MDRRRFLCLAAGAATLGAQSKPTPREHLQHVRANGNLTKQGEDFCWNAAYNLHDFVRAYQAFGDAAWLAAGVEYYEFILSRLSTAPDGYKGWIGPYEYDHSVWCDAHVGDAILWNGLVEFAEIALADPRLAREHGVAAKKYVDLARVHLFEKWDARGTWEEDGDYGAYRSWNRYLAPGGEGPWQERNEIAESGLAHPFNKQDDVAAVAMKLYRITGEEKFRDRAARIFAFQKSRFSLVGDGYVWNYWEPFGARDVELAAGKTRHWVGVHPYRNYQVGEVENMVEAYHTGIAFDELDMRRVLATNLKTMWNGSLESPAFHNSNYSLPGADQKQTAGCLWAPLADFDPTVRALNVGQGDAIARAYFENVTLKRPAGFERRMLKGKARVFDFPFAECPQLTFAAALPARLHVGESSVLASGGLVRGETEISLRSADGTKKLAVLDTGRRFDKNFYRWTPAAPGRYRIRWTFNGGAWREAPVTVV